MGRRPGEDGAEVRPFRDAEEFDTWLAEHHDEQAGVWLKLAKAASGIQSLTSDEAVDVGLCWGWTKVEALTAAGRMRPPGLAEVAAAQADGRWAAAYSGREGQRRARG